jgi:hypothetical protein
MPESWKTLKADEVQPGDTVRTQAGDVVLVSRIEAPFMGRSNMVAFIEDTDERWYKRPVTSDAEVEVQVG